MRTSSRLANGQNPSQSIVFYPAVWVVIRDVGEPRLEIGAAIVIAESLQSPQHFGVRIESKAPRDCPECGGRNLYTTVTPSGTQYGLRLLPAMKSFTGFDEVQIVVCKDCGFMRFFALPETCEKLETSSSWRRVE